MWGRALVAVSVPRLAESVLRLAESLCGSKTKPNTCTGARPISRSSASWRPPNQRCRLSPPRPAGRRTGWTWPSSLRGSTAQPAPTDIGQSRDHRPTRTGPGRGTGTAARWHAFTPARQRTSAPADWRAGRFCPGQAGLARSDAVVCSPQIYTKPRWTAAQADGSVLRAIASG